MGYSEQNHVQEFMKASFDKFRSELSSRANYEQTLFKLKSQWNLIKQMVDVAVGKEIPIEFERQLDTIIMYWLNNYQELVSYEPNADASRNNQKYSSISAKIDDLSEYITSNKSRGNNTSNLTVNFLGLYAAIMSMRTEIPNFSEDLHRLRENREASDDIVKGLRQLAAVQTFLKYSTIFTDESEKLSSFQFNFNETAYQKNSWWKFWKYSDFKIGSAELWLIGGIGLTTLLGCVIFDQTINDLFPIRGNNGELVSSIVTRLLGISLWIYLITFCFKQFSINKHLATLNKHRANALNSFTLFKEAIDSKDTNSRNALMLQVAKAIYEQGSTGHLTSKGKDSLSIIEMTKILGGNQGAP